MKRKYRRWDSCIRSLSWVGVPALSFLGFNLVFIQKNRSVREFIIEINRDYRNIDRSTDVISFALEDSVEFYIEGMPRALGDIFISYDHAKMQAKEYEHSVYREMCFLFMHGILHLLGYDHMEEDEAKEMFALQNEILDSLNITRG